jgi:hypothetical protein
VVSIPACHAGDPGSIPGNGVFYFIFPFLGTLGTWLFPVCCFRGFLFVRSDSSYRYKEKITRHMQSRRGNVSDNSQKKKKHGQTVRFVSKKSSIRLFQPPFIFAKVKPQLLWTKRDLLWDKRSCFYMLSR